MLFLDYEMTAKQQHAERIEISSRTKQSIA